MVDSTRARPFVSCAGTGRLVEPAKFLPVHQWAPRRPDELLEAGARSRNLWECFMGNIHLSDLPGTPSWNAVVDALRVGASAGEVAAVG